MSEFLLGASIWEISCVSINLHVISVEPCHCFDRSLPPIGHSHPIVSFKCKYQLINSALNSHFEPYHIMKMTSAYQQCSTRTCFQIWPLSAFPHITLSRLRALCTDLEVKTLCRSVTAPAVYIFMRYLAWFESDVDLAAIGDHQSEASTWEAHEHDGGVEDNRDASLHGVKEWKGQQRTGMRGHGSWCPEFLPPTETLKPIAPRYLTQSFHLV